MYAVRKIILIACAVGSAFFSYGQSYHLEDLEKAFLEHNYALLAQQYNINRAEAERIQARVWNNPSLRIGEINLWKTYDIEQQGRLFGNYGKNQQIAVELEQLVETAGKRKKRIALSEMQVKQENLAYEDLILELKWNLRQAYIQSYRLKQVELLLTSTIQRFEELYKHYVRQAEKQSVARTEAYRIQSELISLQKEQVDLETQKQETLQHLVLLTQLKDLSLDNLLFDFSTFRLSQRIPIDYLDEALKNNVKVKRQLHEIMAVEKQLDVEKAARIPDLTLELNYDRGGSIMKDFVGVGVRFDLPVFNRNKGNIKAAQALLEREKTNKESVDLELERSLKQQYSLLLQYEGALGKWDQESQLNAQELLDNYVKHLQDKQITLMEFIDFTQSFREANIAYWELLINYLNTYEEMQYLIGKDF